MLAFGDRGEAVRDLQLQLRAAGFDPGDIDGVFGEATRSALEDFQKAHESLKVDGVYGPVTKGALEQALVIKQTETTGQAEAAPPTPCDPATWTAFRALVDQIVGLPVCYGPGRGLFLDGKWVVTQGPGGMGRESWQSVTGRTYPSFHCTSWCNFFLGWLLRYNEDFTHAGNIPSLFDLCEQSDELHEADDKERYRGYGPYCTAILSDGSTYARKQFPKPKNQYVLDMQELYDRRAQLPTFLVWGESTWRNGSWNMWHHTGLFAIDHNAPDHAMYRIAADGYQGSDHRWSAQAMRWTSIDTAAVKTYEANIIFRAYGVKSSDQGIYGRDRSIAPVTLET